MADSMNPLRTLALLTATGMLAFTAWAYPQLPARIPTHFDFRGQPDAWGSSASFLLLPALGILVSVVLLLTTKLAQRNAKWVNMPGKERLLALPREQQQWALEPMGTLMDLTNV